jgi:anti-sigma B factor antagonist/stage II sporulation protein AA (anti-sigma F factor antagonist)
MTFGEATFGEATVVTADGRVDMSTAEAFKEALLAGVTTARRVVVVDMSGVDYISSAGLRSLMIALRSAKAADKAFAVASLTPLVVEIFTISRFNLVFSLYKEVRDALGALSPEGLVQFDAP